MTGAVLQNYLRRSSLSIMGRMVVYRTVRPITLPQPITF